jgi:hypothetical protein
MHLSDLHHFRPRTVPRGMRPTEYPARFAAPDPDDADFCAWVREVLGDLEGLEGDTEERREAGFGIVGIVACR